MQTQGQGETVAPALPEKLYHYCSLQGLRGIIEGKKLHMTSAFWMDDTTEILWFYKVVAEVLDRKAPDTCGSVDDRFRRLLEDPGLSHVYCTCFSEDPDSRSQWLEYADNGRGFGIGFNAHAFDVKRAPPEQNVDLQPVIYEEKQQQRMAEEVIRNLREFGNQVANDFTVFGIPHNTWRMAARCKNPVFASEREWRLIYRDEPRERLKFRERGGRHLIPFIDFAIDPAKDPIGEIWLGPRNQSQRNVDAIGQLLRVCGYNHDKVQFKGSTIPLRAEY